MLMLFNMNYGDKLLDEFPGASDQGCWFDEFEFMMKDLPNRIQQPLVSPGTSNVEFSEYSSEYSSLNVPLDDSNRIGMHDPKKDVLSNAGPFRTTKEKPQTFVKIPRSSNTSISYPNRNNGSKSQQQQQQSHTEVSQLEYPKHHISVPSQSFLNAGENPIPGHNFDKNKQRQNAVNDLYTFGLHPSTNKTPIRDFSVINDSSAFKNRLNTSESTFQSFPISSNKAKNESNESHAIKEPMQGCQTSLANSHPQTFTRVSPMYEQILDACHFPVDKHKNFGSQSELPFIIKNCSSQKIEENDNTEKEKYQRLTKKRPRLTKKCEVKKGVLDEPQKEPAKLLDDVVSRLLCNNDSGSIEFNPERAGEFAAIMGSVQRLQENRAAGINVDCELNTCIQRITELLTTAATAQPHLLSASSSLQPNKSRNDDSHTNTYQNPLNSNSQIVKPVYPQQSNYYCNPPKLDEKRRNFSPPSHQKRSIKNQRKFNSDTNCFIPIPSTVPFDGGVQGAFLLNFDGQKILPVANNCHSIVFAKPPSAVVGKNLYLMNECANSGSKLLAGPPVENRVIVVTSHSKELSANVKSTSTSANVEPIFRPAKKLMMKPKAITALRTLPKDKQLLQSQVSTNNRRTAKTKSRTCFEALGSKLKTFSNFLENCKGISFGDRRQCLMSLLPFSLYHEPEVSKESLEKFDREIMHHFLEMEAQYENLEKLYRDMLYRDALNPSNYDLNLLLFLDAEFERRILDEGEPKPNIKSAFDFDYPDFDATNIAPCRETDLFSFLHSEEEGVSAKEDDEKSPPTVSPNHSGISNVTKDLKAAKNDNNSNREESFDTNIIETSLSTLTDEIEKNGEADLKPFTNNFEEHPHCASYPQMSPEASTTEDQHIKDDNLLDKIEDFPRQSSNDERCIGIEQSDYEYSDQETEPNILHSPLKIKIKLNPDLTLNEKQNRRKGKRRKRKKETRECKDVECKTTLGGLTDPTTVNHQIESCQPGQLKLRIPISKLISNLTDISKNVQNLQIPKSNETDDVRERSNPVVPRLKIRLRTPKENEDHLRNLTPVSFPSPHEFRQNGSSQFVLDPGNIKPAQFSSCSDDSEDETLKRNTQKLLRKFR